MKEDIKKQSFYIKYNKYIVYIFNNIVQKLFV